MRPTSPEQWVVGTTVGHRPITITTLRGGVILTIRGGIGTGMFATIHIVAGGDMVGVRVGTMATTIRIGLGARDTIRRITA